MSARASGVRAALVVLTAASVAYCVVLGHRPDGTLAITLVVVAGVAWALAVRGAHTDAPDRVPTRNATRWVVGAIVISGTAAVAMPPRASDDVWSYAMYARMVTAHDANPYTDVPSDYAADPIYARVGRKWVSTPSRYGPLFTIVSVGIAGVAGDSPLALRLGFQVLAAAGVAAVVWLSWRRWRSVEALVVVALHPLVVLSVLNGAHNDIYVALGVLGALLLLERRRAVSAGLCIALGALVKISALFAVPAIVLWLLVRKEHRLAVRLAAASVVPTVVISAAVPGCLDAIRSAREINHSAIWFTLQLFTTRPNSFPVHGPDWTQSAFESFVKTAALGAVALGILLVAVVLVRVRTIPLAVVAGATLVVFGVLGAWIVPWYFVWGLPLLAAWRGPLRAVVGAYAVVFLAIVHVPLRALHERSLTGWSWTFCIVIPWVVVAAHAMAVALEARGRGRPVSDTAQPSMPTGLPSII